MIRYISIVIILVLNLLPHAVASAFSATTQRLEQQDMAGVLGISAQELAELNAKLSTARSLIKNLNYQLESTYLVNLNHTSLKPGMWYVVTLGFANHDYVNFLLLQDGQWTGELMGDELAHSKRQLRYRLPAFSFLYDGEEPKTLILQIFDSSEIDFEVSVTAESEVAETIGLSYILYGLFFGSLFALALYNLVLFLYVREHIYGWYVIYVASTSLVLSFTNGIGQAFLWVDLESNNTPLGFLATTGVIISMSGFAYSFLNLSRRNVVFISISLLCVSGALVLSIGFLYLHHTILDAPFYFFCSLQLLNVFITTVLTYHKDRGVTVYMLLGYLLLMPSIFISIGKFSGLISSNWLTNHSFEISFLVEAFILSLGVGEKIRQLKNSELAAVEQLKNRKQQFLRDIITVREKEKRELGAILHNSVAQNLAVVGTRLNQLRGENKDTKRINDIIRFVQDTSDEIRNISHQSYPHYLQQFGLSKATEHYAETNLDVREIDWACTIENNALPEEVELVLYRTIQECINNVYRHAQATIVLINLQRDKDHFVLAITDDGVGFDSTKEGFGITLIRQYAGMLHGKIDIKTVPGSGVRIKLTFPVSQPTTETEQ